MTTRVVGVIVGAGFGFVIAWAGVTDPNVIRQMLLLRDPHVFLIMGAAIVTAGLGTRVLRVIKMRSIVTREPISWSVPAVERRHITGSVVFGAGWSVACTCPGPIAAMVGQGHAAGLVVGAGLIAGIVVQRRLTRAAIADEPASTSVSNVVAGSR